jgi:prepilin-type N-terminal cleavage/methylation domain-containing protein
MTRRWRRHAAFSLLELLAVVIILGVIAAIVIGRISTTGLTAKENACMRNKAEINRVIERYYFDNGVWASDIADIAASPEFPEGLPACPVNGSAYAIDPGTNRVAGHTSGSH